MAADVLTPMASPLVQATRQKDQALKSEIADSKLAIIDPTRPRR